MIPIIQMVWLKEGYPIFIKQVRFKTAEEGDIRLNGKPAQLAREEHFVVEEGMVLTTSFSFPVGFLFKFLDMNGAVNNGLVNNVWLNGEEQE